jgi:hypothetical protein
MAPRLSTGVKEIWQAGFSLAALDGIRFMSGLVEVEDVLYTGEALFFYVRCTDSTHTIFRSGFLRGTHLSEPPLRTNQPLLVVARASSPLFGVGYVS